VHRDDADVFVLQVSGTKTWYVHDAPAGPDWSPGELPDDERSPRLLRTVLEPGGVLYVPRASAHRAVGSGGLSAHLSLTIRDVSLQHLQEELAQWLWDGLSLPGRPLGEAGIDEACETLLGHCRSRLEAITPHDLRAAARASQARQSAGRAEDATHSDVPHSGATYSDATFAATASNWPGTGSGRMTPVRSRLRKLMDPARDVC
jgi:hypothetical protein